MKIYILHVAVVVVVVAVVGSTLVVVVAVAVLVVAASSIFIIIIIVRSEAVVLSWVILTLGHFSSQTFLKFFQVRFEVLRTNVGS